MIKRSLFITILIMTAQSQADFEFFRGVRQMGMGGASIAVVNDETAVLSNPNGLGRLRDFFYTVIDPEVTVSDTGVSPLIGTGLFDSVNPEALYNELEGHQAKPYYFKAQTFPSIVLPNFGIGILGRYEVLAERNNDGTYDYNYQNDYSLNLAYNMNFLSGRIKLGFAGRLINRVEHRGTLDPATESLAMGSLASEGKGVAVDTGLTLSAPWRWIPTATVYVRDVGGTSFRFGSGMFGNSSNGTPAFVSQSIDVAFALFPIFSNDSRGVFTVEYTGINTTSDNIRPADKIHIGTEINVWDAYFFRAGYHRGDWTAGFEYATGMFQWQLATYAEEVLLGVTTTSDRRGVVKFGVRF